MDGVSALLARAREIWSLHVFKLALLFQLALGLTLSFFPLFDVLGFERAFVTGLFAAPWGAAIALALLRQARRKPSPPPVSRLGAEASATAVLLLAPTALCGLFVELVRRPCDPGEGAFLLLSTAGVSGIFGACLGTLSGTLSKQRALPLIVVAATLAMSLGASLLRLYTEPQIFVFNLPFGYWPGSIYDEEVGLGGALLYHRLFGLLISMALLASASALADPIDLVVSRRAMGPRSAILALTLIALAVAMDRHGETLGFDITRQTVEKSLLRRHEGEHYTLYADGSMSPEQLEDFSRDIDFRYAELVEFFGRHPEHVSIYLYRDVGQKRALMGAARTQIAKPWSREIHIHGFEVPHGVLKHELAHVFAAEFSRGPFGVPVAYGFLPNIGVIEGLAVAADWRVERGLSVHESTRAMRDLNLLPDLERMFYPAGFWSISSSRAYTAAGSFLRYLYERHGRDRLLMLYASNDFEAAYGEGLETLVPAWRTFLDGIELPAKHLPKSEQRFKQPAIFEKACAHEVAELYRDAHEAMSAGDIERATEKIERAFLHQPWRNDGFISLAASESGRGQLEPAKHWLEKAKEVATTSGARTQAESALADLAWESGDVEAAQKGFDLVLASHPTEETERLFLVKRALLERPPEVQAVVRPYLLGRTNQVLALVELIDLQLAYPGDGLLAYLLGRRLESVGAYARGVIALDLTLELGLPEGRSLAREAHLTSGRLLYRVGDFDRALQRFQEAAALAETEGERLFAMDWANRTRFHRRARPE